MGIKRFKALLAITLLMLCVPSFCVGESVDGYFWKQMDQSQKHLYVMGYQSGSLNAGLILNSLANLRKEVKRSKKASKEMEIASAYCTDTIEIMRKAFMRETYIPEEIDVIVEKIDAFYAREHFLKTDISEALTTIRNEMYEKNPKLKKSLTPSKK